MSIRVPLSDPCTLVFVGPGLYEEIQIDTYTFVGPDLKNLVQGPIWMSTKSLGANKVIKPDNNNNNNDNLDQIPL